MNRYLLVATYFIFVVLFIFVVVAGMGNMNKYYHLNMFLVLNLPIFLLRRRIANLKPMLFEGSVFAKVMDLLVGFGMLAAIGMVLVNAVSIHNMKIIMIIFCVIIPMSLINAYYLLARKKK